MWNLERALGEIAGLPHVSLQPSAGSHGELAGVLLTQAPSTPTAARRGTKVLTPDTAHGTNPATVTMAGYEVVKVGTNADGGVDLDDLRAKADDDVACLMLTNPNTLGIFDAQHRGDRRDRARRGGDALLRRREPQRRHGHLAARATWASTSCTSTCTSPSPSPTAAAARARARSRSRDRIEPFLPRPVITRDGGRRRALSVSTTTRPKSIGKLRGFQGNYGCFVRSYAYIRSLGRRGAARTPRETAVLNANYLLARLRKLGVAEQLPLAFGELCMHEFVLSGAPMKKELGIRTLDLAKRLLDHGFHPPTVYFPLLVDEALLIEPTETETQETLDAFADAVAGDPERGRARTPRSPARRPTRRRCAASTRPARRQAPGHPPGAVAPPLHLPTDCRRTHAQVEAPSPRWEGRRQPRSALAASSSASVIARAVP